MQVLHERFADDPAVEVLAVHADDRSDGTSHIEKHGYTFRAIPKGGEVAQRFGISAVPTFLIIAPDGTIIHQHKGRLDDRARREIERIALEASAQSN